MATQSTINDFSKFITRDPYAVAPVAHDTVLTDLIKQSGTDVVPIDQVGPLPTGSQIQTILNNQAVNESPGAIADPGTPAPTTTAVDTTAVDQSSSGGLMTWAKNNKAAAVAAALLLAWGVYEMTKPKKRKK